MKVALIDRQNHHLFSPHLYQVATDGLCPADIAAPIRKVLSSYRSVRVVLGEVNHVNPKEQRIQTTVEELS